MVKRFLFSAVCAALLAGAAYAGPALEEIEAGTGLAQSYYLQGEAEPDRGRRAVYLDKAITAADKVLGLDPGAAHALYWRAMAYLQKADIIGGLGALGLVKHALRDLEIVAGKDPTYDFAGAYRSRGKVLIEAPRWALIGDRKKGLLLLKRARDIAPGFLINRLYLAQACVKNGRTAEARAELDFILASRAVSKDDLRTKEDARGLLREIGR